MNTIYIVWAYDHYYPSGPGDIRGVFFDRSAADSLAEELSNTEHHDCIRVTEETVQ
jgi:hypothetical protein